MTNAQEGLARQWAFVLHSRPYRESSALVELFTLRSGRITVLAKGARRSKSPLRSALQPFTKLDVRWRGRGTLPTLCAAECVPPYLHLTPDTMRVALYLNELLMRTLARADESQTIFTLYEHTLEQLARCAPVEATLRYFERHLLDALGYGIPFTCDAKTKRPIEPQHTYVWISQLGFVSTALPQTPMQRPESLPAGAPETFLGAHLLAIGRDDYSDAQTRSAAKRLFRSVFRELLGTVALHTRALFPHATTASG